MSLPVGIFLLILVNIELILRKLFLILKVNFDPLDDKDKESLGL